MHICQSFWTSAMQQNNDIKALRSYEGCQKQSKSLLCTIYDMSLQYVNWFIYSTCFWYNSTPISQSVLQDLFFVTDSFVNGNSLQHLFFDLHKLFVLYCQMTISVSISLLIKSSYEIPTQSGSVDGCRFVISVWTALTSCISLLINRKNNIDYITSHFLSLSWETVACTTCNL